MNNAIIECPVCGSKKLIFRDDNTIICQLCDSYFKENIQNSETRKSLGGIYKKAIESTLEIYVYKDDEEICGTGVYINEGGYILTSAHIFDFSPDNDDSTKFIDIVVVQKDKNEINIPLSSIIIDEQLDLAILKIDEKSNVTPINISKENIEEGDTIYVVGNNKGEGLCLINGIVSDSKRMVNDKTFVMITALLIMDVQELLY